MLPTPSFLFHGCLIALLSFTSISASSKVTEDVTT